MASVWIRVRDFDEGTLPAICVRTGEPTTNGVRVSYPTRTAWPWLIFGFVPFLLVAYLSRSVEGWLPISVREVERVAARRRQAWVVLAIWAFAMLAALGAGELIAPVVAVGLLLGVTLAGAHALRRPLVTFDRTEKHMHLGGVHARFREAAEAQRAARRTDGG